jgi:hypothetical protein
MACDEPEPARGLGAGIRSPRWGRARAASTGTLRPVKRVVEAVNPIAAKSS